MSGFYLFYNLDLWLWAAILSEVKRSRKIFEILHFITLRSE